MPTFLKQREGVRLGGGGGIFCIRQSFSSLSFGRVHTLPPDLLIRRTCFIVSRGKLSRHLGEGVMGWQGQLTSEWEEVQEVQCFPNNYVILLEQLSLLQEPERFSAVMLKPFEGSGLSGKPPLSYMSIQKRVPF